MSRIEARFAALEQTGEGALVVFIVAGHPTPAASAQALDAIARAGADVIELGIPFSDPLADGPVIQAASQQALAAGMTPAGVLDLVRDFRRSHHTPIVLMTCYNPIYQFGVARFAETAAAAGVDGVIVTDLPPEEATDWVAATHTHGLDRILLLAPTSSPERVKAVAELAGGFVYCVSRLGVTGARSDVPADLQELVGRIRAHTDKPVAVGFGVAKPEHVARVCAVADGAVVGSAVVARLGEEGEPQGIGAFVESLKAAARSGG